MPVHRAISSCSSCLLDDVSAFWLACNGGSRLAVRLLLSVEGRHWDAPAPDGTTAFAIALGHGHTRIVDMILSCESYEPKAEAQSLADEATTTIITSEPPFESADERR